MQRVNQKIPGHLGRLAGLLKCSHCVIAARYGREPPTGEAADNVRGEQRGWLQLNLMQKLQRMEHFGEGATQNIRIRAFDSPPSHGMRSDESCLCLTQEHFLALEACLFLGHLTTCFCHGEPSHEKRPAFLNPYAPAGSCLYHFRKRSWQRQGFCFDPKRNAL